MNYDQLQTRVVLVDTLKIIHVTRAIGFRWFRSAISWCRLHGYLANPVVCEAHDMNTARRGDNGALYATYPPRRR